MDLNNDNAFTLPRLKWEKPLKSNSIREENLGEDENFISDSNISNFTKMRMNGYQLRKNPANRNFQGNLIQRNEVNNNINENISLSEMHGSSKRGRKRKTQNNHSIENSLLYLHGNKAFQKLSQNRRKITAVKQKIKYFNSSTLSTENSLGKLSWLDKANELLTHLEDTLDSWRNGSGPLLGRSDACDILQQTAKLSQAIEKKFKKIKHPHLKNKSVFYEYQNSLDRAESLYSKIDGIIRQCDQLHIMEINKNLCSDSESDSEHLINSHRVPKKCSPEIKPILKFPTRYYSPPKLKLSFSEHSTNIYTDDYMSQISTKLDSPTDDQCASISSDSDAVEECITPWNLPSKFIADKKRINNNSQVQANGSFIVVDESSQKSDEPLDENHGSFVHEQNNPDKIELTFLNCKGKVENNESNNRMLNEINNDLPTKKNSLSDINKEEKSHSEKAKKVLYNPQHYTKNIDKIDEEEFCYNLNKSEEIIGKNDYANHREKEKQIHKDTYRKNHVPLQVGENLPTKINSRKRKSNNEASQQNTKFPNANAYFKNDTPLESDLFSFDKNKKYFGEKTSNFKTFKKNTYNNNQTRNETNKFTYENKDLKIECVPNKELNLIDETSTKCNSIAIQTTPPIEGSVKILSQNYQVNTVDIGPQETTKCYKPNLIETCNRGNKTDSESYELLNVKNDTPQICNSIKSHDNSIITRHTTSTIVYASGAIDVNKNQIDCEGSQQFESINLRNNFKLDKNGSQVKSIISTISQQFETSASDLKLLSENLIPNELCKNTDEIINNKTITKNDSASIMTTDSTIIECPSPYKVKCTNLSQEVKQDYPQDNLKIQQNDKILTDNLSKISNQVNNNATLTVSHENVKVTCNFIEKPKPPCLNNQQTILNSITESRDSLLSSQIVNEDSQKQNLNKNLLKNDTLIDLMSTQLSSKASQVHTKQVISNTIHYSSLLDENSESQMNIAENNNFNLSIPEIPNLKPYAKSDKMKEECSLNGIKDKTVIRISSENLFKPLTDSTIKVNNVENIQHPKLCERKKRIYFKN